MAMGSQEFTSVIKAIGTAKSRMDEEYIVNKEIVTLKKKMSQPDLPPKTMKELILRLLFVEMLGRDASFGHIHAVKMTQSSNLLLKKVGYLAVTQALHPDHELILLIVNTIQRDLTSDNILTIGAALSAASRLMNQENIPAILPSVTKLLNHSKDFIRKRAVMTIIAFYKRCPETTTEAIPLLYTKALLDKSPSVMSAAVCSLNVIFLKNPITFKSYTQTLCTILKQIIENKLPRAYMYHGVCAPWIQISILQILAALGEQDQKTSQDMYAVVLDTMHRGEKAGNVIGFAIMIESAKTIASLYPNDKLLTMAAKVTEQLLKSPSNNLKTMGINTLSAIVKVNPKYAVDYQVRVVECLESKDHIIKRSTLQLLYQMANPSNVSVVVSKIIEYLKENESISVGDHIKEELVSKAVELAERFAPSNEWFISTMNSLFYVGDKYVRKDLAHNLMRLIAEGSGEDDDDADNELRASAVVAYLDILMDDMAPQILKQIACWVIGEYAYIAAEAEPLSTLEILSRALESTQDEELQGYLISAMGKICAQEKFSPLPPLFEKIVHKFSNSLNTNLQQRCYELMTMLQMPQEVLEEVMPIDGSCEDIEVDEELTFLNGFVQTALNNGAKPYVPGHERALEKKDSLKALLNRYGGNDVDIDTVDQFGPESTGGAGGLFDGLNQNYSNDNQDSFADSFTGGESNLMLQQQAQQDPFSSASGNQTKENVPQKWDASGFNPGGGTAPGASDSTFRTAELFTKSSRSSAAGQDVYDGVDSASASASGRSRDGGGGGASRLHAPPQEDEESLAKTQLANSIFGGGDMASSAGTAAVRKAKAQPRARTPTEKTAAAAVKPKAQADSGLGSLLDFDSGDSPSASSGGGQNPSSTSTLDVMNELQGLDIGPGQSAGAAPPSANLDLNSLYTASQNAYAQQAMMGNMQQPGQNPAYMQYQGMPQFNAQPHQQAMPGPYGAPATPYGMMPQQQMAAPGMMPPQQQQPQQPDPQTPSAAPPTKDPFADLLS